MLSNNIVSSIWNIAELLRGDYKQSEYGRIVLPFTLLRRLDCMLEPTKDKVLESPTLRKQAMANTKDRLIISPDFEREFTKAVIGQMGINQKMSEQILNDREKRLRFSSLVIDLIYQMLREPDKEPDE